MSQLLMYSSCVLFLPVSLQKLIFAIKEAMSHFYKREKLTTDLARSLSETQRVCRPEPLSIASLITEERVILATSFYIW